MTMRRHEEALAEAKRARELSPLSSVINAELGTALVRLGRCDEAVAGLHKTLEIDPQSVRLYQTLGEAYDAKGQWAQGLAALEKSDTLSPAPYPWLGFAYGMAGRRREALGILARLDKASRERFVSPQSFAVVHLGLGDREQALAWLEKAYDEHAFEVLGFSGEIFDHLRDDPRFQDLLRRMRLPIAGDPAPRRHASLLMRPHG